MNIAMSAENQMLQNDNRQLIALIREYEQTLETVMASFRTRAYEVQEHELALMRDYESNIIQRETEALDAALTANNARSVSFARVGRLLRTVMRKLGGEDIQPCEDLMAAGGGAETARQGASANTSMTMISPLEVIDRYRGEDGGTGPEGNGENELTNTYIQLEAEMSEEHVPERRLAAAEWALERECELARLERENEELRRLLHGVLNANTSALPSVPSTVRTHTGDGDEGDARSDSASHSSSLSVTHHLRQLGGPPGTVGPFGTYKRRAG
ncbi:hypothetical protein AcW1_007856 [Taiwanofungus camphoratus]|nr:hypothetical protein AcW2_007086 [Antrodia cinnamomea]KAI0923270.1 hypothetical protein AcV7_005828 [Antrodia cinnamomea]KAI0926701.1 hypothetical protein AcV5_007422 [Antrodia cinnamomea]KAI0953704.1 hypothetical protein AcW1_007856 [Antrodia cinnamomea]